MIADLIGKSWKYSDESESKELQTCLDKGIPYQECYAGLNYYNYWQKTTVK